MGPGRDLEAIEERRLKGARLLKSGVARTEAARRLEASRQAFIGLIDPIQSRQAPGTPRQEPS